MLKSYLVFVLKTKGCQLKNRPAYIINIHTHIQHKLRHATLSIMVYCDDIFTLSVLILNKASDLVFIWLAVTVLNMKFEIRPNVYHLN